MPNVSTEGGLMSLGTVSTLARAALRSVRSLLDGRVQFPRGRLGDAIRTEDGTTFVVYRETALRSLAETSRDDGDEGDGVVLVFRMRVTEPAARGPLRDILFDPVANVATPFFAGMPGFRRKLWLAGERPGEFLELYEWATEADADRFADVFRSLLDPVDHAGTASFEVLDHGSVESYVGSGAVAWTDAPRRSNRPRRRTTVLAGALAVGVALAVYALGKRAVGSYGGGDE